MDVKPQILFGQVMHARLLSKCNRFTYGIYYLYMPLTHISPLPIAVNKPAMMSFYDRDHGGCDGSHLQKWAQGILLDYGIKAADGSITLICMPRVLGYVFNPVSFWLCRDQSDNIRAVLCEVNNTFGERHVYVCAHDDHRPIEATDVLEANKVFHVSPLLKCEGHYRFRFDVRDHHVRIYIDFYNSAGDKQLVTSLTGQLKSMNKRTLRQAFWCYPLVTVKAIVLIHWQALKLLIKGIRYIAKPQQHPERVSAAYNLTKR